MTNRKSTGRALLLSALALLMCVAMLVGTTFAWFTDSASTGVNKIVAGNLDIELQMKDSKGNWVNAEGKTLPFLVAGKGLTDSEQILWEPGCTYYTTEIRVLNKGTLAVKFEYVPEALGVTGKLAEVLEPVFKTPVDENDDDVNIEPELLLPGEASPAWSFGYHMLEEAGNEYQEATATGMCVTVVATQATYEKDSFDDQYDKDAEYDEEKVITVNDAAELTAAIKSAEGGETIRLGANIEATSKITVNKEIRIDLAGFRLSGAAQYTLQLSAGANVTVSDSSDGAAGVITNTYSDKANPATVDLQGAGAVFTLESGTVLSNAKDNLYTIAISNSKKTACTVNINGGTVSNPDGHVKSRAISASKGMTVNINGGTVSGGLYALDTYAGSVSNINGGKLFANAIDGRSDEYGTSYAIHAKGEAKISIGSAKSAAVPDVKGIKFESSGVKTELPTINLVKGEITNPIYSLETKYNYSLFKLGIIADAPVTFTDNTASFFLPDDLQMVQNGSVWTVTAK